MTMQPKFLTLSELLHNKLFKIPAYQRGYEWQTKQRKELFDDLIKISNSDEDERIHFMNTIVVLSNKKSKKINSTQYQVLDVVDGQQRLTTLIILLRTIASFIDSSVANLELDDTSFEQLSDELKTLNDLLVKKDKLKTPLLQTNHDDSGVFSFFLRDGTISKEEDVQTFIDKNMLSAFNDCQSFVNEFTKENHMLIFDLIYTIKSRLGFILHQVEDEGVVYRLFESVNNRGVQVDHLDRFKNIMMNAAYEQKFSDTKIFSLNETWTDIYKELSFSGIPKDEILKFSVALSYSSPPSKLIGGKDCIDHYREQLLNCGMDIDSCINWVLKITRILREISEDYKKSALTKISHARLLLVALKLIGANERIIKQWEITTFRIFGMMRRDSRFKVGDFIRLSNRIIGEYYGKKSYDESKILDEIIDLGNEYPVQKAIDFMKNNPDSFSSWESEAKYLLSKYEEHLSESSDASIAQDLWDEIWKNTPRRTLQRIRLNSEDSNMLGNLVVVLPEASKLNDTMSFQDIKELFQEKGCDKLLNVLPILQEDKWTHKFVKERTNNILSWAEKEFQDLELV